MPDYLGGHGNTWTTPAELAALRAWSRTAKLAVEVGTWTGRSAEAILQGMDDGGTDGVLICVDHFQGSPGNMAYGRWVEDEEGREKVKAAWRERLAKWGEPWQHYAGTHCLLWEMESADAAKEFGKGDCWSFSRDAADFIFLDGDHLVPAVQRDIDLWWPLVRSGGFLCGHDYNIVLEAVQSRFAVEQIQAGPGDLWRVEKT